MTDTPHIGLPMIDAAQAQKHVTHNDALQILDALVQLSVLARDVNAPPGSPAEGARYIVGAAPTGAYAGHAGAVATWLDGVWRFFPPRAGFIAHVEADAGLRWFDGAQWRDFAEALRAFANLDRLGIGTSADAANPLAAKLNATLFTAKSTGEGGSGDLRFKLNKSAAANVVSQLYQDNFSGRAETGLIGDDHFSVKVSPDGATWRQAIDIDPATGIVGFPSGAGAGSLAGFRNRVINGAFAINQRSYVSGAALGASLYAHDRWKAGAAGVTYTFTTPSPDSTLTISAGSLLQIIDAGHVEGGDYTLSWTGSAQGRVNSGAYAASPVHVGGVAAGTAVSIEFGTGTLGLVQFEPTSVATAFERRPYVIEIGLCRYYFRFSNGGVGAWYVGGASAAAQILILFDGMRPSTPSIAQVGVGSVLITDPGVANVFFSAPAVTLNSLAYDNATVNIGIGGGTQTGSPTQYHVAMLATPGVLSISKEL